MAVKFHANQQPPPQREQRVQNRSDRREENTRRREDDVLLAAFLPERSQNTRQSRNSDKPNKSPDLISLSQLNEALSSVDLPLATLLPAEAETNKPLADLLTGLASPTVQVVDSGASEILASATSPDQSFAIERLLALQDAPPAGLDTKIQEILQSVSNKAAKAEQLIRQLPSVPPPAPPSSSGSILSKVLGAVGSSKGASQTTASAAKGFDPMSMMMMMLMLKKRKKS